MTEDELRQEVVRLHRVAQGGIAVLALEIMRNDLKGAASTTVTLCVALRELRNHLEALALHGPDAPTLN